ncbi:hypothetical protein AAIP55_002103 [Flavobacterium psychrophilum]|nr:hypothetical protein [Flavobacterium psychrophilum]EKT4517931.1 hypothetical protein [Flavobacterium psychrophilum]
MKYLLSAVILILSYFVCVQHDKISSLNSQVNSLDYKIDNIKKKDFPTVELDYKETFYLAQLSNSTTLVLSVIGFALVIAGIFSFSIIDTKFKVINNTIQNDMQGLKTEFNTLKSSVNTSVNSLTNEVTNYSENYKKYESRHNDFEFRLNFNQANENINKFYFYSDKKSMEYAVYHSLYGLSDFTNCYFSNSVNSDLSFKKETLSTVRDTLLLISKTNSYKVSVQLSTLILENIKNIRRLGSNDIDTLLSKVHSSIKFENREV